MITKSRISGLIRYWARELGLGDWRIRWTWGDTEEVGQGLPPGTYVASTQSYPSEHQANIVFNTQIDHKDGWWETDDIEETIVHELVHVRLKYADAFIDSAFYPTANELSHATFQRLSEGVFWCREEYVNTMTELLLRQKRKKEKKR